MKKTPKTKQATKAAPKKRGGSAKPAKNKGLTVRQERFCEFIVAGVVPADAWMKAGYKATREGARRCASVALTKVDIKARVAELRQSQTKKALLTKNRKRALLMEIAENPKMSLDARIRAMAEDSKLAGHYEPDRVEVEAGPTTLQTVRERAEQVVSILAARYGNGK